jgi:putative MATE family efflux protein
MAPLRQASPKDADGATQRRSRLIEGPIHRALVGLGLPLIAGNVLQYGYQLTDAFWLGRLGAAAVAAVSASFPWIFLVIALGAGFAIAGATLCAQYTGAGQHDRVDHIAAQSLSAVALAAVPLGLLGCLAAPLCVSLLDLAPDVRIGAVGFLRISFIGIVFVFLYAVFQALMASVGQTRISLRIIACAVALNFVLDPLFIFGWGPLPGLGVAGAALATLVTQAMAAGLGIAILARGHHGITLRWRSLAPDAPYIRRAIRLGFPGSMELAAHGLALMAMSVMVTRFGTVATAAYGIGLIVLQIMTIPAMGLATAAATLVGQAVGAGRTDRAARVMTLSAICGFAILSLGGVLAYGLAPWIIAFFVPGNEAVIAEGSGFIRIMCLTWGGIGIQLAIASSFRASGNMLAAMTLVLLSQWLLQLPLAYVLSTATALQAQGLWWSFPVANIAVAALAIHWFSRGRWKAVRLTAPAQPTIPISSTGEA